MKKVFSIILIVSFVIMLAFPLVSYPLLHRFDNTELEEKRDLAEFPEFGDSFGANFDSYFNDHLPFRNDYIKAYLGIEDELNSCYERLMEKLNIPYYVQQKGTLYGKEDWLFYAGESSLANYMGTDLPTDTELAYLTNNLNKLVEVFSKKNISISVMIIPNKERVYNEYMPDALKVENQVSRAETIIKYFNENSSIDVVYPKEVLVQNKANSTYYKYDTHWTNYGAFLGMNELLTSLGRPMMQANFQKVDRQGGDLANFIGKQEELIDTDFIIDYTSVVQSDEKIVFLGDSFRENISAPLLKCYPNAKVYYYEKFEQYLYNEELFDADRLVIECVERYTTRFFDLICEKILQNYN